MKLSSMKNEAGSDFDCCSPCCGPGYAFPYGLTLELNADTCDKLGISKMLAPGTVVSIQAKGVITRASQELDRDGDAKGGMDLCLSVQITDMGMQGAGTMSNAADTLYPKS